MSWVTSNKSWTRSLVSDSSRRPTNPVAIHNNKVVEELAVRPFTDEDLLDAKFEFETSTGCDW